ncbi:MAG: thioredoxin domain-containing protein [Micromonosporaceae bacterium]|nr:thioredoxin domain-containing protein [Micromonosporaceae bacterium]
MVHRTRFRPEAFVPWLGTLARLLLAAVFAWAASAKVTDLAGSGRAVNAESTLDQMVSAGRITLIYHPIAILDQSTNPSGYSTRAGSAAGCAADGGKFLEYTKALYAQPPAEGSSGLTDEKLIQIGNGIGLTGDTFSQCINTSKYSGWMANNTDAASGRHIQGTPTVFVAGKQIDSTVNAAVNAAAK